jgi:two-component sensor histidine kinase
MFDQLPRYIQALKKESFVKKVLENLVPQKLERVGLIFTFLFGFYAVFTWTVSFFSANEKAYVLVSVVLVEGVCLFLCFFALQGVQNLQRYSKRTQIKNITSRLFAFLASLFVVVFSLYTLAEKPCNLNMGFGSIFSFCRPTSSVISPCRMAPNSALAFVLALFPIMWILVFKKLYSPALSLFGILATGIGAAALWGYVFQVETAYGWGVSNQMSFPTSVALIILGATSSWTVWNFHAAQPANLKSLWNAITVYSTAGAVVVAAISSGFTMLPFYEHIKESKYQDVKAVAANKMEILNIFLHTVRHEAEKAALNISSRQGSDAALASYFIKGYKVLSKEGKILTAGGIEIPDSFLKKTKDEWNKAEKLSIETSFSLLEKNTIKSDESNFWLVLPVKLQIGSDEGHALFLIGLDQLEQMLPIRRKSFSNAVTLYMIHRSFQGPNTLLKVSQKANGKSWYLEKAKEDAEIKAFLSANEPLAKGDLIDSQYYVASLVDSKDKKFQILSFAFVEKLYEDVNEQIFNFVLGAFLLALIQSVGTYFLVKKLAQRGIEVEEERSKHEKALGISLEEKEVLLKEVHHRVKNNLQVITSLLRLQSREAPDHMVSDMFMVSQNRIRSISLLHELLYQSDSLAEVSLKTYLKQLAEKLIEFYQAGDRITLVVEGTKTCIDLERAVPCGLLVNELITNSIKHGLPNGVVGKITLKVKEENNFVSLSIIDSGGGVANKESTKECSSLGFRLVEKLVQQIDGTVQITEDEGYNTMVKFPLTL